MRRIQSRSGHPAASLRLPGPAICLLLPILAGGQVSADENDAGADGDTGWEIVENVPEEAIDEIVVLAPKTITAIKAQIVRAEMKMYGLYNEMNADREYDIYCRRESVYASNRKERACLAQFEHGVLEESWNDLSTWTGAGRPDAEIRQKREILRQKMIDFAEQNAELKKAIFERAELQRHLREAEARRGEGDEEE